MKPWKISILDVFRFLYTVLIFFTPLIFVSNTHELYEFPKTFFIYLVGTTIIFLFLIKLLIKPHHLHFPKIPVLLFVGIYILTTIFSSHLYTSVWGYYSRFNGGLVSVLILFGLYFVYINTFSDEDKFFFLKIFLLTMLPVSLLGIYQHFRGEIRVYSTFGQPNWLAAYIVSLLPINLYLIIKNGREKLFWIFTFIAGYACLWFTYSLSGLLGFLAGIVLFTYFNFREYRKNIKSLAVLLASILLISVLSLGTFKGKIHDVLIDLKSVVTSITVVYAEEAHAISDPGYIRTGIWEGTLKMIFSSPKNFLIGTGPETFPYVFPKFRVNSLNYSSEWDFILNKPHNYYLELWAQMGLLGLISYLLLAGKYLKVSGKFIAPGLFAFLITNIFGWPVAATSLLFWIYLSLVDLQGEKK